MYSNFQILFAAMARSKQENQQTTQISKGRSQPRCSHPLLWSEILRSRSLQTHRRNYKVKRLYQNLNSKFKII